MEALPPSPPRLEVEDEVGKGGWRRSNAAAAGLNWQAGFATVDLGCRFSFWLLVDNRYIKSILPKTRTILLRKRRL
jgi:hypothetical protein